MSNVMTSRKTSGRNLQTCLLDGVDVVCDCGFGRGGGVYFIYFPDMTW